VLNIVMTGFFGGVTDLLPLAALEEAVKSTVPKGTEELNLRALRKGYDFGREHPPEVNHGTR
jgi:2-oxoglutarate ferredoxin oxidoreductase subunit gamma